MPFDQGERELLAGGAADRVGPVAGLFGQDGGRRGRGDRCVEQRVLLVRGRLQVQPGQHRVVHPHRPGRAVLDQQVGVPGLDRVEPVEQCPLVFEQSVAERRTALVGAGAGHRVVVELEEADAEVGDQPVDRVVEVLPGGGLRRSSR